MFLTVFSSIPTLSATSTKVLDMDCTSIDSNSLLVILRFSSKEARRSQKVELHLRHLYLLRFSCKPTRFKRMGKSIISCFLEPCLYRLSKPHSEQRPGGLTASTLNIISVSFSCGGSIVLRSGRNNRSDKLFILYYSVVLMYQVLI